MTPYRITADLDATAQAIANHLASAAVLANNLAQHVLAQSNDDLAAWLNAQPPESVNALFEAHAILGNAINAANQVAAAALAQWGVQRDNPVVDVRSVPEKLGAQYRAIELTKEGWAVTELERPKPEPEPEPEPTPEP